MFKYSASSLSKLAQRTGKKMVIDNRSGQVKFISKAINHSSRVSRFQGAYIKKP